MTPHAYGSDKTVTSRNVCFGANMLHTCAAQNLRCTGCLGMDCIGQLPTCSRTLNTSTCAFSTSSNCAWGERWSQLGLFYYPAQRGSASCRRRPSAAGRPQPDRGRALVARASAQAYPMSGHPGGRITALQKLVHHEESLNAVRVPCSNPHVVGQLELPLLPASSSTHPLPSPLPRTRMTL